MFYERLLTMLLATVDELNSQLPKESQIVCSAETVLFGEGGQLDSLNTANFLIAADEKLSAELGREVNLAEVFLLGNDGVPRTTLADLGELATARYGEEECAQPARSG